MNTKWARSANDFIQWVRFRWMLEYKIYGVRKAIRWRNARWAWWDKSKPL